MVLDLIKDLLFWLFIFVVGSLIVYSIIDPVAYYQIKDRLSDLKDYVTDYEIPALKSINNDSLVSSCLNEYDKYSEMGEKKWGNINHKLISYQKVNSDNESIEFYDLYGGSIQLSKLYHYDWDSEYPVVLIFSRMSEGQREIPIFTLCKSDGKLTETSKVFLRL